MKLLASVVLLSAIATGQPAPSIASKTKSMTSLPGYFPLYWDASAGKIWLEVDKWSTEFLYLVSLPAGVGSNDIGLDRGQLGGGRIVRFERSGNKVLLVQPNYEFRAITSDADEQRSVADSFAQSVLWGFTVEAEQGDHALVDATAFFLRDVHDVAAALKRTKQGAYHVDASRSALYLPRTKNFPKNTEVEATITLTGDEPGAFVREVTPTPDAITVREHQSFIELPEAGYQPRAFDPRAGYFGISFMDFATPLGDPVVKRFIERHRLQKKDPSAAISEPVKPIVYYLDRGAPEPIRSALLEGANWWSQAFEAAGFRNAFRVELMPDGADPMDIRYNVIQWVHRSSRGWSYGATVADPRTGEILKGHVTLGSLRGRQDYLIAEGLLAPYEAGKPVPADMERMVLARLRQLAAHEVGHTLGLAHNFAASVHGRASVMDYPHPLIALKPDGSLDLSNAYATGTGEWDKVAIAYGYQELPAASLSRLLNDAHAKGMYFISDADSRPQGGAHPYSHLWDNGGNPVDELNRMMQIRARVLERFSERNIREGAPMSTLEEVLVPMFLLHRYQTEAAAKMLGGLDYRYAVRGDGELITKIVPGAEQRRALDGLLRTIDPAALTLPERILQLIPPRAEGYARTRELFAARTGPAFDPMAAVEAAANITVALILNPERDERLIQYHARDSSAPDFAEVTKALIHSTFGSPRRAGLEAETQRVVEDVVLYHLMALEMDETAGTQVRAVVSDTITSIKPLVSAQSNSKDPNNAAHAHRVWDQIVRFEKDPKLIPLRKPVDPPPGQPIGMEE